MPPPPARGRLAWVVLALLAWPGARSALEVGRRLAAPIPAPRIEMLLSSEEARIRRLLGEDHSVYEVLRDGTPPEAVILATGLDPLRPDPLPRYWWIRVLLYPKRFLLEREFFARRRREVADPFALDERHFVYEPYPGAAPPMGGRLRAVRREERFTLWRFVGGP